MKVIAADRPTRAVLSYLGKNVVRNALDTWLFTMGRKRYSLRVCLVGNSVKAHLGTYDTPEAKYTSLGGDLKAAGGLLRFIPDKAVITTPPKFRELVTDKFPASVVYPNDIMILGRGDEKLQDPGLARKLTSSAAIEYATFGSSFNVGGISEKWSLEQIRNYVIFGIFVDDKLASVATIGAWLPKVAVILAVETKPEFRGKGLGAKVVSAAVQEALKRSQTCSLFVRSDNEAAVALYRKIGFRKFGEELWIDKGTGIIP